MTFTHVDKPITLAGSLTLKNRIVRPAHGTHFARGIVTDDLIAYHEARAAGGVALSILEILSVHPSSGSTLRIYEPGADAAYRKLVDTVRPHGMALLQQLWHGGHTAMPIDGSPPWSSSDVPNPKLGVAPIPMTKAMIDTVVEAYANSAALLQSCGLDGVEIHCAHGYLPYQFMSPLLNHRQDDYGGDFENRARFMLEVVQAVRNAVKPGFVVGVRVAPDVTVGGIGPGEALRAVQMLEARSLVDYVSVSMGSYYAYAKMVGGMHEPTGYELPTSTPVTRAVASPTIVVGRFRTLEEADQVIRNGDADMVGMVRALIADPDLVRKSLNGAVERVRPCIGCNQACAARPNGRMGCAVNPAVGYEAHIAETKLASAASPLKVLVIGGGPAGLEAARIGALRGHQIILAEAQPVLGGALRLAAQAPTRHGIGDILHWLEDEVYRLGVDVRLSHYMDLDDITALDVDKVILATGSIPRMDGVQISNPGEPIKNFDRPNVFSSHDLFTGALREEVSKAVVIDDLGHYEAIGAAEFLVARGVAVDFVTRHASFAPLMDPMHMTEPALSRLGRGVFSCHYRMRALSIDDGGVTIAPVYRYLNPSSNETTFLPAEAVIFVSRNRADRTLYSQLHALRIDVQIIGDANTPGFLETAMRDGRLGGLAV